MHILLCVYCVQKQYKGAPAFCWLETVEISGQQITRAVCFDGFTLIKV